MKRALFFTAYDRPNYLLDTLTTWREVRGFHEWDVVFRIEPSPVMDDIIAIIDELEHPNAKVVVNPHRYGVLHHPWVGFNDLFKKHDFVVRAEDDLLVSDDILEYFEWASLVYEAQPNVAAVIGYSDEEGEAHGVRLVPKFSPWIWGTWKDRWESFIRDTWDHDYSTYNGHPGNQSGWDWNLDTRIYPERGLLSVVPTSSRAQNIGVFGTHGNAENFVTSPSFSQRREPGEFHAVR